MGEHQKMLFRLAREIGEFPISTNTGTKVLTNGKEKFPELLKAIENAEHHIHMQYYIVRHDKIGTKIKDLLIEKAKSGVKFDFYMMLLEAGNYLIDTSMSLEKLE